MDNKIDEALEYYLSQQKVIIDFVNGNDTLGVEEIIEKGEELAVLEYKITALQVAKEN
ncbi:hypothetical protein SAMN05421824_0356 [Hyunsoonleella jejuensis]|uniref:Uncharacterized protein n=1 Tax=Hyunsoonleella jejuensis TaxID=419940 RepID=A0A1H9AUT0_9FLAO|nr:hypothetical protein [Hyunsoonleella jejuensis]SEP80247.1 hypothetical protein SAMN05421824_0356 [Hyunsoonleella jejuensis]